MGHSRRFRSSRPDSIEGLAATVLAGGRLAIGAGLWLAPGPALRALGFSDDSAEAVAVARIAATRDLILGAWQLRSLSERGELRRATVAVAAADAGDTLVFALGLRAAPTRPLALRGLPAAAAATALGAWLARRLH